MIPESIPANMCPMCKFVICNISSFVEAHFLKQVLIKCYRLFSVMANTASVAREDLVELVVLDPDPEERVVPAVLAPVAVSDREQDLGLDLNSDRHPQFPQEL